MVTRRKVLAWLPVVAAWVGARGQGLFQHRSKARAVTPALVYFGTDTRKGGAQGIYVARFDEATGKLTPPVVAAACLRPSFLALGQVNERRLLYAVNESDAKSSAVQTYLMDAVSGGLKLIGQVSSGGAGPCYVGVHPAGTSVYVANYDGGSVTSFKVQGDGTLSDAVDRVDFHGKPFGPHGPNGQRQDGPHPHSATVSPDGRYLVVCDLGTDVIAIFPIDGATGKMGPPHVTQNRTPGAGPRHVAFHPNGRWIYGIDELTSKIDLYLWNEVHGAAGIASQALLTVVGNAVSTLAEGFHGANTAAEICVGPDGRTMYASNRGENSLVVYGVNAETGALTLRQRIACGGKAPRDFALGPTGKWLVCGNEDSGVAAVFARDENTGMLRGPVQMAAVPGVQFVLFV